MRRIVIALALAAPLGLAQTAADFFDDNILQEIRLDVSPADWNTLRANYELNDYYPATFHWLYKGQTLNAVGIGIRSRGRGSRTSIKPNLRIDFNHYPEGKKFLGLGSAILKSNSQDTSMVRETTVFKLFDRSGLPASRETHTRLYVNNEYYGVYTLTEEIKGDFLKAALGESNGELWEWSPIYTGQGWDAGYHWEWAPTCQTNQVACSGEATKWDDEPFNPDNDGQDVSPLIDMIRQTTTVSDASFETTMGNFLDLKLWLFHNALEVFVADFDSILGDVYGMNNFYLYRFNKTTFSQFLVWDKDSTYDWSQRDIFQNANQNVLMRRLLAIPARRQQYLEGLNKVAVLAGQAGGWAEWETLREATQIRQAVYDDAKKVYFKDGIATLVTNDMFEAEVVKDTTFLEQRTPWLVPAVQGAGLLPPSSIRITDGGVVNAATNAAGQALVAGSLVSLYGNGLASSTVVVTSGPLPTVVAGVSVIVNGFYAPLLYVSPTQINFQVPWEVGLGDGTAPFTVTVASATTAKGTKANSAFNATFSNTISAPIKRYAPGVFLARRADGSAVAPSAPAAAGDVIVIYMTGLGPVTIPQTTGVLTPAVLSMTTQQPRVTIGNLVAEVQFSGLTPGTAGVYQLNVRIPVGIPVGTAPLVVSIAGESSPTYSLATR